jgi:hypothetical protein
MADNHRSAMGKSIDMAALRAKNQNTRAVGNMNVDAEGNTLDSHGQIIETSTQRVGRLYDETTQNPGALRRNMDRVQPKQQPIQQTAPTPAPQPQPVQQATPALTPAPTEVARPQPSAIKAPPVVEAIPPVADEEDDDDERFMMEWDEEIPEKTESNTKK